MELKPRLEFITESINEKIMSDRIINAALNSCGIHRENVEVDHDEDDNMLIIDIPFDAATVNQVEKFANMMGTNLFHKVTQVEGDKKVTRIIFSDNELNEVNVQMLDAKISVKDAQAVVDKAELIADKKDALIDQLKVLISKASKKGRDYIKLNGTDAKIITSFK